MSGRSPRPAAATFGPTTDLKGRPLRDLRLSATDRCNLRCTYCMPAADYTWLPRQEILSFDEILVLVGVFISLGVDKVRITGGEPLLRKDLSVLIGMLSAEPRLRDLAMTTNGVLLSRFAENLRAAGLHRVTVSLDTLQPARFEAISQRSLHSEVLEGLRALDAAGFTGTKIDTVVVNGMNDDELVDLLEFGVAMSAEVRFIEYMDVGGATEWRPDLVVSRVEILRRITATYGPVEPVEQSPSPATRYRLPDGRIFGIIASTTEPFCATCDRSRVTADGMWYRCLYARTGTDLREPLRSGASPDELRTMITDAWRGRQDQGAVDRLANPRRGTAFPVALLKQDPHLEMHTRGG